MKLLIFIKNKYIWLLMEQDEKYISMCMSLAKQGIGKVSTNPMVGCVIVHQGRIIGQGYHEVYGGIIDITSRKKYIGQADYEFVDQDGTPWPIRFNEIKADTSETTVGRAVVTREESFYMSPYFAYFGKVGLRADRKALDFDGSTHIESNCAAVETDWFDFNSIVDPSNIIIDLPEVDPNDKTKTLASGIYMAADTIGGYAAFLSKKVSPADKQMFFANGKLYFDEGISSYVITTAERLENSDAKGNYLAFNSTNCTMHGDGFMSLGDGKTQLGLNILADFFNEEGWAWGAAWGREDSMHFEVSKQMLQQWRKDGKI